VKNWTVRQRIIASFSVVVIILLLLSATAYYRLATVEQAAVNVRKSAAPGMQLAGQMRLAWADHLMESQRLLMVGQDDDARRNLSPEESKVFCRVDSAARHNVGGLPRDQQLRTQSVGVARVLKQA
jgi:methyl-accepting chemotaxis protein WspA